jgi:hypothetical protein
MMPGAPLVPPFWRAVRGATGRLLTRGNLLRAGAAAGDSPRTVWTIGQINAATAESVATQHVWMDVIHCVATHPTPPKISEGGGVMVARRTSRLFYTRPENFEGQQTCCGARGFGIHEVAKSAAFQRFSRVSADDILVSLPARTRGCSKACKTGSGRLEIGHSCRRNSQFPANQAVVTMRVSGGGKCVFESPIDPTLTVQAECIRSMAGTAA